jgi:hypothetical protein
VVTVFAITDGADGQYNMYVGINTAKEVYRLAKVVGTLIHGEYFFLKEMLGALLTVVDDFASCLETIDMVGAEGQEGDTGSHWRSGGQALNGMENAGRVIHDTIGIDGGGEGLVAEALAYGIGKTRTHEENLFAGLYMEWRLMDDYLCAELHHFT